MALSPLGLGFLFTAKDLASGTIDKVNRKVKGLGDQTDAVSARMKSGFGLAAASVVPLAAGGAALAASFGLAKFAAPFTQGVQRVGNIAGATAGELDKLRDAAIDAGLRTQFSPKQAVDGLGALAAQGFKTHQSIELLNESLNLAAGGQIGIEDATKSAAAAIRVFNEKSTEQRSIADRLLKITNMTALGAGDLTLALGTVSKGAGLTSQKMDEMLVSMGLVRNAGLDVSVAASSVSSALQFVAKNSKAFSELGVSVTDSEGNFRDFLDIISETDSALSSKFSNAADRSSAAMKLFGRFGIAAFQNISNQAKAMVGTVPGVNTMSDAITHLREEMQSAGGTAQEFADNLLNTFAGQSDILSGATETLGTVLGESFAKVLKPVVKFVAEAVSSMARAWDSLPDGVKTAIAGFVVVAGVILTVAGVIGVVTGLLMALGPIMATVGAAMATGAIVVGGLIAAVTAVVAVFALFKEAADRNLGGFGDMITGTFDTVKLAFKSIGALFSEGKLTGPLAEQFLQAGKGTQSFVKTIFRIGSRVKEFFGGLSDGFSAVLDTSGPSFQALVGAFQELGEAFGFIEPGMDSLEDVGKTGKTVGETLGQVFRLVIDVLAVGIGIFAKLVRIIMAVAGVVSTVMTPVFMVAKAVMGFFFDQFISGIHRAIAIVGAVTTVFNAVARGILTIVDFIIAAIMTAIDSMIVGIAQVASLIPENLRPDFVDKLVKHGDVDATLARVRDRGADQARAAAFTSQSIAAPAIGSVPVVGAQAPSAENQAILAELKAAREEAKKDRERPINVSVAMDGEQVGSVTANASRKAAASAFVPVGAGV